MTKNQSNQDLQLKILCKVLFSNIGYNTHYEVKLRTKSYIQLLKTYDVSDIDVYGIKIFPDMSVSKIGAECKSGEKGALDELYKFLGVINYLGINRGYFIKNKIHQNARQIASVKNISCFTEAELRQLLLGFNIDIDKRIKIENAIYNKLTNSLKKLKLINEKLVDYIYYGYWNKENWKSIHNLLHLLKNTKTSDLFPESDIQLKTSFYYIVELFSLTMLLNLSEAMIISYSAIEGAVKNSLYGGAENLSEKQKIYDLVSQVNNKDLSFSPNWEDDFINLSVRFSTHTKESSQIVNFLQSVRENSFYSDKINISNALLRSYGDLTRKYTQDIIQFLSKYSKVEIDVFKELMEL